MHAQQASLYSVCATGKRQPRYRSYNHRHSPSKTKHISPRRNAISEPRGFCAQLIRCLSSHLSSVCQTSEDTESEEIFEQQVARHRPESLAFMVESTDFTKQEIRLLYRGFKQLCPNGIVTYEQFKQIYLQFFPRGADSSRYATYVFNTFDVDGNGQINFEEFARGLSVISRGNIHQKLNWVFTLYDINRKGYLEKEDFEMVIRAIYSIMGKISEPPIDEFIVQEHVNEIFNKMNKEKNDIVSKHLFIETCLSDETVMSSLILLDTIIHNVPSTMNSPRPTLEANIET